MKVQTQILKCIYCIFSKTIKKEIEKKKKKADYIIIGTNYGVFKFPILKAIVKQ